MFSSSSHGSSNQPAEVFRKDLISAMKLPDSYQLQPDEYMIMTDNWKPEWEKGVQVPVNPKSIPNAVIKEVRKPDDIDFKLGKKLIKGYDTDDEKEDNAATGPEKKDAMCQYDLDEVDSHWLCQINKTREEIGEEPIDELTMERIIEECDIQCNNNMEHAMQTEEGLGIEYDEDVICDVCRAPDSEEGNEMVFCDKCDICVHQACYGIVNVPEGSWMCRTCALGIKPACILCGIKGGAMKSTRSGTKWSHVSCALWVPEVSIGCVERMEPITKISQIPASRWALICVICRERTGACIQCSVKTCKTAYHVTCGFRDGLEMKTYLDDEADVRFRSYCMKHTKARREMDGIDGKLGTPDKAHGTPKKDLKEMTQEERANERAMRYTHFVMVIDLQARRDMDGINGKLGTPDKAHGTPKKELKEMTLLCLGVTVSSRDKGFWTKIQLVTEEFYRYTKLKDIVSALGMKDDVDTVDMVYEYWKLKRKSGHNKPLVMPIKEVGSLGSNEEYNLTARMKMFVHLRQDLERVRNLCYMVQRREKLSRQLSVLSQGIFRKQCDMFTTGADKFSPADLSWAIKVGKLAINLPASDSEATLTDTTTSKDCDTDDRLSKDCDTDDRSTNEGEASERTGGTQNGSDRDAISSAGEEGSESGKDSERGHSDDAESEDEKMEVTEADDVAKAYDEEEDEEEEEVETDDEDVVIKRRQLVKEEEERDEKLEEKEEQKEGVNMEGVVEDDISNLEIKEHSRNTRESLRKKSKGDGDKEDEIKKERGKEKEKKRESERQKERMKEKEREEERMKEKGREEEKIKDKKREEELLKEKKREEERLKEKKREEERLKEKKREEERLKEKKREEERLKEKKREEERLKEKKREEERMREKKREEERLKEKKREEERLKEKKREEERMREKKREEDRLKEKKREEERLKEKKREEERLKEKKREEERLKEKKREEERLREKKREEERLKEKKREEERLKEKKREEERLKEKKREEEKLKEKKREEERLKEKKREEERLKEKKREEERMKEKKREEERLKEMRREEERLREKKREEERMKEKKREEERLKEKKREEERLKEKKREEELMKEKKREEERLKEKKREEERLKEKKREEEQMKEKKREEERAREKEREKERKEKMEEEQIEYDEEEGQDNWKNKRRLRTRVPEKKEEIVTKKEELEVGRRVSLRIKLEREDLEKASMHEKFRETGHSRKREKRVKDEVDSEEEGENEVKEEEEEDSTNLLLEISAKIKDFDEEDEDDAVPHLKLNQIAERTRHQALIKRNDYLSNLAMDSPRRSRESSVSVDRCSSPMGMDADESDIADDSDQENMLIVRPCPSSTPPSIDMECVQSETSYSVQNEEEIESPFIRISGDPIVNNDTEHRHSGDAPPNRPSLKRKISLKAIREAEMMRKNGMSKKRKRDSHHRKTRNRKRRSSEELSDQPMYSIVRTPTRDSPSKISIKIHSPQKVTPKKLQLDHEATKLRQQRILSNSASPRPSLKSYHVAKKKPIVSHTLTNGPSKIQPPEIDPFEFVDDMDEPVQKPETRSRRKLIEDELDSESSCSDRQFETVDKEVSMCLQGRESPYKGGGEENVTPASLTEQANIAREERLKKRNLTSRIRDAAVRFLNSAINL